MLEVGVGTGLSTPHYPKGMEIIAVDLSLRMLERARARGAELGVEVDLREADAQALPFPGARFDTALASCVFCSVPDPVLRLGEIRRVLAPGGQLLMLEHVLSHRILLGPLMRLAYPIAVRVSGANINRETVENVQRAGFVDLRVQALWLDIVKLIEARAPSS